MTPYARLDRARQLLDTPPPAPPRGQLAIALPPPTCEHGNPQCGTVPARLYPCGFRCDQHQPSVTRPYNRRQEP